MTIAEMLSKIAKAKELGAPDYCKVFDQTGVLSLRKYSLIENEHGSWRLNVSLARTARMEPGSLGQLKAFIEHSNLEHDAVVEANYQTIVELRLSVDRLFFFIITDMPCPVEPNEVVL